MSRKEAVSGWRLAVSSEGSTAAAIQLTANR